MNMQTYVSYLGNPNKISSLIDQNSELVSENKAKDKILANISHEIRNPISIIIGAINLLRDNFQSIKLDQESQEYLDVIEESSQETLNFTQDLLEISQLNSGEFNVDLSKKIDLEPLLKRVIKTSKYLYLQSNININHKIDSCLPQAMLDPRRMKQILVNLISNSIKYSSDTVIINIAAKHLKLENKILISISDNGLGMSEDEVKKAMQEFQTIHNDNSHKVDSFGLGLPLVKYLVESQNGTMQIKSSKGVGTTTNLYFNLNTN